MPETDEPPRAMTDAAPADPASTPAASVASGPVTLEPVTVAKPWGAETWYSGIERRGESYVRFGAETESLSAFLARHGRTQPPILLKRLVPSSGHLYLEVHRTKHEVYVVDRLDPATWPDGRGEVLCGVNPEARSELGDHGLRQAILYAAQAAERGETRTSTLDSFMSRRRLTPGDSLEVKPGIPHSLRQGVEVIEFQTPVYERLILAASQPVVTQDHWDSAAATATMHLTPGPPPRPANKEPHQTLAITPAFTVIRHLLPKGTSLSLPAWCVGWIVHGGLHTTETTFNRRQAFLTPTATTAKTTEPTEVLIAHETA